MADYDISKAFKRIENDLMESLMRNMKRHQAEELKEGFEWEQWQALQLRELERYRHENSTKFSKDFKQIDRKIDAVFRATSKNAKAKEENKILDAIKKGNYHPPYIKDDTFFTLNDEKLNKLIEATRTDFARAEYALLRKADDMYRKVIFDAQVYGSITNDYNKAVDMATHDFLLKGIQSVTYKNGAKHNISSYAEMAIRTGNKRAYLMGEGNAHDKFGIHTVRVNKRTDACPKCVKFLGRVLVDDVYSGGTAKEAHDNGVPTLSQAMQAGFLHPNCRDVYSLYMEGISQPATPWTKDEIEEIVGDYNHDQEVKHAEDMVESYKRMAKFSLDPANVARYTARADNWQTRLDELNGVKPVEPPKPTEPPKSIEAPFTDAERDALDWYASGEGMWINQYLRGNLDDVDGFTGLSDIEKELLASLDSATNRTLEYDKLYRSVDAKVIFEGLDETEIQQMVDHLLYGNYDKGAYSQNIKKRMEKALAEAKGKTITEKGFMSTTVDKQIAEEFGYMTGAEHPVVIELDTKGKKIKGADLTEFDIAEDPQKERLLARNTRYKINDISVATDAKGSKYIKVSAELIDQGAEVAEEVIEEVVPPISNEEELIRQRIADIKARGIDDLLKEAEKEKDRLNEYNHTFNAVSIGSKASDEDIITYLEGRIKSVLGHDDDWHKEIAVKYQYIIDHIEEFEKGTYLDDVSARIKDLKKQSRVIQKELDVEYDALEKIIGEPNVTKLSDYKEKNTKQIRHLLDDTPELYRDLWNEFADNFKILSGGGKGAYYSASQSGVKLSINSASKGSSYQTPYQVVFHEYGHSIDWELNRKYGNGKRLESFTKNYKDGIFGKTIQEEATATFEKFATDRGLVSLPNKGTVMADAESMVRRGLLRNDEKTDWVKEQLQKVSINRVDAEKEFCKYIKEKYTLLQRTDISDMFESIMKTVDYPFGVGHGSRYWRKNGETYIACGQEAFAEMYSAVIANKESWEVIQEFFPKSVKIFREMIDGRVL